MAKPYLLWTLNGTAGLLTSNPDIKKSILAALPGPGAFAGDEPGTGRLVGGKMTSQLLPDKEYFVPIVAKCLGSRLEASTPEVVGLIRQDMEQCHWVNAQGQSYPWQKFWDAPLQTRSPSELFVTQMTTQDYQGYYDLLCATKDRYRNVLIGYSQGGLVARYLGYLEEHVFREGAVSAVISVHSPNHGSPLANPATEPAMVEALVGILAEVASLNADKWGRLLNLWKKSWTLGELRKLLADLEGGLAEQATHDKLSDSEVHLRSFCRSTLKWLSGLEGCAQDPAWVPTAFTDLNFRTHRFEHSVLSAVNRHPLQSVQVGNVVSANNRVLDVAYSFLDNAWDVGLWFVSHVFGWVKTATDNIDTILREKVYAEPQNPPESVRCACNHPEMVEDAWTQALSRELQELYQKGRKASPGVPALGAQAHDFVIPSASQSLSESQRVVNGFLGEWVNPKANHNSGMDPAQAGGQEAIRFIRKALSRLN